jgi:tryptophan 2,3-dioxygenase
MTDQSATYWDYLRLVPLLKLQNGMEEDDSRLSEDELHFIVVHQVFELWLKLVLRELRLARDRMVAEWVPEKHIPHVVRHLRRVTEILRLGIDSFGVLETLTPQDFLAFRKKLGESSGFQSYQMRQMELLLGLSPKVRPFDPIAEIERAAQDSPQGQTIIDALKRARAEASLRDALLIWLSRTPIQGSLPAGENDRKSVRLFLDQYRTALTAYDARLVDEFQQFTDMPESDYSTLRARAGLLFIESYRDLPLLSWPYVLIETVVEMEEQLVLWRTRHARMVERMIGRRFGTGGSAGVSYLDVTTQYRIFSEFWTVRTLLLPRELLPPLLNREIYELKASST